MTSDGGLYPPLNPNNGQFYGLSHISFCYDVELRVSKTANTTYNRDWDWDIAKAVLPTTLDLFQGQTGDVDWTVTVTKSGPEDSGWNVAGDIVITNPAAVAATVVSVTDDITGIGAVPVTDCAVPFNIAAGATKICHYTQALPNADARTNTATVTTSGAVNGGSAQAGIAFGFPTNETDASINVSDTVSGDLGAFTDSGVTSYSTSYTCDADAGQHSNTATIPPTSDEGEQNATATTNVVCHDLTVTKDARTSQDRVFAWNLSKSSPSEGGLILQQGQVFDVTFSVNVNAVSSLGNHAVAGTITVHNPAPIAVNLLSVTDQLSGGINAVVDCGPTVFPYSLAAGADLVCAYLAPLPDGTNRTNTATATTEFGVPYSGSAAVSFAGATTTNITPCVAITDSQYPGLAALFDTDNDGFFCVGENGQPGDSFNVTKSYVLPFTAVECGVTTFTNVVNLSTGATDSVVIPLTVPCDTGCTLTQGYWKTHSSYGPAKHTDAGWFEIGDVDGDAVSEGPDETFFLSGKTWYQVFNTPPAGNPYYIAAHQYMGAVLNIENGASSTPAVDAGLAAAKTFFQTYAPSTSWTKAQKTLLTNWGTLFNSYNTGLTGPGHCSENGAPVFTIF